MIKSLRNEYEKKKFNQFNQFGSVDQANTSSFPKISKSNEENILESKSHMKFENTVEKGSSRNQLNTNKYIQEFTSKLNQQQKEINLRNDMISYLQKDFQKLQQLYIEEKNQQIERQSQLDKLQQKNSEIQSVNNKMKAKLIDMEENDINNFRDKLQQLVRSLQTEKQNLVQTSGQNEANIKELLENSQNHTSTSKENKDIYKAIEKCQNIIKTSLTQINKYKNDSVLNQQDLQSSNVMLKKLKQKIKEVKQELEDLRYENKYEKDKQKEIDGQIMKMESQRDDLQYKLSERQKQYKQLDSQFADYVFAKQQVQQIQTQLQSLETENTNLKQKVNESQYKLDTFKKQIQKYEDMLQKNGQEKKEANEKVTKELNNLRKQLEQAKLQNDSQKQEYLKQKYEKLLNTNKNLTEYSKELQRKQDDDPTFDLEKFKKEDRKIFANLSCQYCGKTETNPVTCIPCGHSYCAGCEKGYRNKVCYQCGPRFTIEAVYRNELLDELIQLFDQFKKGSKQH